MERRAGEVEWRVVELATAQHGVVSAAQLRSAGLSGGQLEYRVQTGRLHRVHRGVYAVGRPVEPGLGHWMAAVLACGPRAVLSHRSAAALWGFRANSRARPDVTGPRSRGRHPGIDVHHPRRLDPRDVTTRDAIPVTRVARTLLDLADVLSRPALERAVHEAEVLRLLDVAEVEGLLARSSGRRGLRRLADAVRIEAPPTRRELERRMAALLRDAGIDAPRINTIVDVAGERHEVDFLWLAEALVVETDGFATHGTRRQFERDRARDAHLQRHGYLVQRFSWRQVVHDPAKVAGVVRDLLVARRSQEFGQPHRTSRGCRLPAAAPD